MIDAALILFGLCAVTYLALALVIGVQARHSTGFLLAFCCLVTAAWGFVSLFWPGNTISGLAGAADLARGVCWYGFVLHLYRRSMPVRGGMGAGFLAVGIFAAGLSLAVGTGLIGADQGRPTLLSLPILVRIGVAVAELLLIENLYFNLPTSARWHVALPCVLLGGLACFDLLLCGDLVLFTQKSASLANARATAMVIIAPVLVVAAARDRRWRKVQLSRTAAFHSATLILSGSVLLALSAAGEIFRQFGPDWGWIAKSSLLFAGVMVIGIFLTSGSARSRLRQVVIQHFFASRYDYRRQWLDCIDTLSDPSDALHSRAIRALADVVDSPNGALFLREGVRGPFAWAGSWNMPSSSAIAEDHSLVTAMRQGEWIAELHLGEPATADLRALGPLWLAVPLVHRMQHVGFVLAGPSRAKLALDQEVFDLLRIVGREVATYIAEQRATQVMLQTRQLHDYSKRFAFVAHDIKNVSSQLSLLLSNAERHISNPEFQRDMLQTVSASVQKITALLARLDAPEADRAPSALEPVSRLEALVATYERVRRQPVELEHDGSIGAVAMSPDAFDTSVTHLMNNAVEASEGKPVKVMVRHEVERIVIEIQDQGMGMSEEFVRDRLFQPFRTSKRTGSGIGAFQARELLREVGGELLVESALGKGTTMRLILARVDRLDESKPLPARPEAPMLADAR